MAQKSHLPHSMDYIKPDANQNQGVENKPHFLMGNYTESHTKGINTGRELIWLNLQPIYNTHCVHFLCCIKNCHECSGLKLHPLTI